MPARRSPRRSPRPPLADCRRSVAPAALLAAGLIVGSLTVGCVDGGDVMPEGPALDASRDAALGVPDRALPSALDPDPEPEPGADAGEAPCVVGSIRCEDSDTFATCLRDRTWGTRDCDPGQVCNAGRCRVPLCAPGDFECASPDTVRRCDADGDGWTVYDCPVGVLCDDAIDCGTCAAGDAVCVDDTTARACGADGVWGPRQFCPNATACTGGDCVRDACITRVLLLVDRSGSMGAGWRGVGESINAVLADHPDTWFGLAAFPSNLAGCGLGGMWPQVPIGVRGREGVEGWLASTSPRGDTPLVRAMGQLADRRIDIFGPGVPGHVVVLTDGADSCGCVGGGPGCTLAELEASATDLLAAGVQTHVIGYDFRDDPQTIDALAAAGGGPFDTHIPAGDEFALREVFARLVDDIKACP